MQELIVILALCAALFYLGKRLIIFIRTGQFSCGGSCQGCQGKRSANGQSGKPLSVPMFKDMPHK